LTPTARYRAAHGRARGIPGALGMIYSSVKSGVLKSANPHRSAPPAPLSSSDDDRCYSSLPDTRARCHQTLHWHCAGAIGSLSDDGHPKATAMRRREFCPPATAIIAAFTDNELPQVERTPTTRQPRRHRRFCISQQPATGSPIIKTTARQQVATERIPAQHRENTVIGTAALPMTRRGEAVPTTPVVLGDSV
jgi:hypothetical protein